MLTISQLASYAGVTVRAVRHYHAKGLLPEPERDYSGYRRYDAKAVVELIKIKTLAEAGVPLARVQELLAADDEEFATAVDEIDRRLRREIRERQEHRRQIAKLAAGDSLSVPDEVVTYLDRMRAKGIPEVLVEGERDGWILMAARWPERIPEFMADKLAQLEDPRTVRLYQLIAELLEVGLDEERLNAVADLMVDLTEQAAASGELEWQQKEMNDEGFVDLVDSFASDSHPLVQRLQEIMAERGWSGWSRMQRADVPADRHLQSSANVPTDDTTDHDPPARRRRGDTTRERRRDG
jgi:DNA-binding transcriptional MerR regulator